jgi:hypothetical protein
MNDEAAELYEAYRQSLAKSGHIRCRCIAPHAEPWEALSAHERDAWHAVLSRSYEQR